MLRLAECEHGHRLHQALCLRGNVELLCVQRLDPFAAGRPAGPGKKARRWRKQLQLDLASLETRQSAWQVVQVDVERRRTIPASAAHEIGAAIATLGRNAGNRPSPEVSQEPLAYGMRVNVDNHSALRRNPPGTTCVGRAAGVTRR